MPDLLANALAVPGLGWLVASVLLAGIVRGFAGFGTAMIFLPVAAQFLDPFSAITALIAMDLIGPLPNMPRAFRDGQPPDILRMAAGMIVALPVGIFFLTRVEPAIFRYGVSIITGLLLAMLILGLRYSGRLSRAMIYGTGAASGLLGGSVGVAGPPVIMLYMASDNPAKVIRANITIYLILIDAAMLMAFWMIDRLDVSAFGLGLFLAVPFLLGNVLGAKMFRPGAEHVYRVFAYAIIAVSALSGLPVFD